MSIKMDKFNSIKECPTHVDIAIIGGGIIGISTALFLAEEGISVVVLEKGKVGHEQSGRNWGWIRVMGRDINEIPMVLESQKIWDQMQTKVGADIGFRRSGIVYLSDTEAAFRKHQDWVLNAEQYQIGSRLLSSKEIEQVLPGSRRNYAGGLFTPNDCRAEPEKAVPAMAHYVERIGGTIVENCAVRGIETSAGRVSAIVTEKGVIKCQSAVLAGGVWSRLFLGNMGIDFPQLKVQSSVIKTKPLEGPPSYAVGASDYAFRKRLDGGYTIAHRSASVAHIELDNFKLLFDFLPALVKQKNELRVSFGKRFFEDLRTRRHWKLDEVTPFEHMRILDLPPNMKILSEAKENLIKAFPAFSEMKVADTWSGIIDAMPDAMPVIDTVPRIPGFYIASGFSGHGFGIGPGAGKMIAKLVSNNHRHADLESFKLDRFKRLEKSTKS